MKRLCTECEHYAALAAPFEHKTGIECLGYCHLIGYPKPIFFKGSRCTEFAPTDKRAYTEQELLAIVLYTLKTWQGWGAVRQGNLIQQIRGTIHDMQGSEILSGFTPNELIRALKKNGIDLEDAFGGR